MIRLNIENYFGILVIKLALLGEFKAVEKYLNIRKGLNPCHLHDMLFEIITDKQKHAALYNCIYINKQHYVIEKTPDSLH